MKQKILITGALGQLGHSIHVQLVNKYNILLTDLGKSSLKNYSILDITSESDIKRILQDTNPEIIINLAAYTDVDGCENNPQKAFEVNFEAVELLLNNYDGYFIQISTDYVFDGKNGPYSESDETSPISEYGKSKLAAEQYIENNYKEWCIVRTNVLFDYQSGTDASFIKWIIESLNNDEQILVVIDQWNNPTWTYHLASILESIIENKARGLFHYGGADYLSRYEFALMIAEVFNLDSSLIKPIKTVELNQVARRPLNGGLKTDKIEQTLNLKSHKLRDSLIEIKSRMK